MRSQVESLLRKISAALLSRAATAALLSCALPLLDSRTNHRPLSTRTSMGALRHKVALSRRVVHRSGRRTRRSGCRHHHQRHQQQHSRRRQSLDRLRSTSCPPPPPPPPPLSQATTYSRSTSMARSGSTPPEISTLALITPAPQRSTFGHTSSAAASTAAAPSSRAALRATCQR